MNVSNMSTVDPHSDVIQLMQVIYEILTKYIWMITVVVGIPGNMLSIVVTTREQNRRLSPCVYMTAMAVVDTLQLVGMVCWVPLIWWDLLPADIDFESEEIVYSTNI